MFFKNIGDIFCIVSDLNSNLMCRKENNYSFPSLNRFFTLPLHRKRKQKKKKIWKK